MSKLVIVESPAKAKTISQYLGKGYEVQASFGHIRDLPESAEDIPAAYKGMKWAKLGVNVENNFEPLYIVPGDKKRHVDNLKKHSKEATELLLATDEDREGESISWHIVELLKPKKSTPVRRIVFHEITPEAIRAALNSPRDLDVDLVRAQEARRILDRLYGYSLSPVLWKKVAPKLSAGRVQSVTVRLIVERERERMRFIAAEYWDLQATFGEKAESFAAQLTRVGEQRVATGKSFDPTTGKQTDKSIWVKKDQAEKIRGEAEVAKPYVVSEVETSPGTEKPPAPFMTSTLQQEANRKLRMSSKEAMQVAQQLYEGIEINGQRVGLITYMRTDSLNLADRALTEARVVIADLYGPEYLPPKPVRYKTKSKGAQEAHEAIRPTDLSRRPADVQRYLDARQFALYELIWKRTIACQMPAAQVLRTSVTIETTTPSGRLGFSTSGKQITFPGFLRAYFEGSDDPEAEIGSQEKILPPLKKGQEVTLSKVEAQSHSTRPAARYTEASLVKRLEEEGIGRPSTYATIMSTIQDRGYVNKRANELVPTFVAFAVTELLENHFPELVDVRFTARMEERLDDIAEGKADSTSELKEFYIGDEKHAGLVGQIATQEKDIPYPLITIGTTESGEPLSVRVGRYGTFVQRGEGGAGNVADLPDDLAPAELTVARALELIERKSSGQAPIGVDPDSGREVFFRNGRFGDYLELAQTEQERESGEKPKRVTLPKDAQGSALSDEDLKRLLSFPRTFKAEGGEITIAIGKYGPYVKQGDDYRNVESWRKAADLTLEEAQALLAQPKVGRTSSRGASTSAIKEFGEADGAPSTIKVMPGRFGPYVTDGKVNATIPKTESPESLTLARALELIEARAAAGPSKRPAKRFAGRAKSKSR